MQEYNCENFIIKLEQVGTSWSISISGDVPKK